MEKPSNDYNISFFKPTTDRAKFNRDLVVWLASIWFVAIFGFHILLRVIEKPTPEPAYTAFISAWDKITAGAAGSDDLAALGSSTLSVLGKIAIAEEEKSLLSQAMSWSLYTLTPEVDRAQLIDDIKSFETIKAQIEVITDPEYVAQKRSLMNRYASNLGLSNSDVRSRLMPIELTSENIQQLDEQAKQELPVIMEKYLVHNQSFLTDFKFLGFPFHYFYSAVFLLILFVGLCWLYCIRTDRRNAILNIND